MTRSEKQQFVQKFQSSIEDKACMIIVRQTGLVAGAVAQLRRAAHQAGVTYRVIKNRLAKQCFQNNSNVSSLFKGPTGVFLAENPVETAKLILEFSKKREKLFFPLGGIFEGKFCSGEDISTWATLPSVTQIYAQIIGLIASPATRLVSVIQEPGASLARLLNSHSQKNNAE